LVVFLLWRLHTSKNQFEGDSTGRRIQKISIFTGDSTLNAESRSQNVIGDFTQISNAVQRLHWKMRYLDIGMKRHHGRKQVLKMGSPPKHFTICYKLPLLLP
jgi:hypothetical protein